MVNRVLIRMKVVQMLFCYFMNRNEFSLQNPPESDSKDKQFAYSFYLDLLIIILKLSGFRTGNTGFYTDNKYLIDNKLGKALRLDSAVKSTVFKKFSQAGKFDSAIEEIYKKILSSSIYSSMSHKRKKSLTDDMEFWNTILTTVIESDTTLLHTAREDESFTMVGYERAFRMAEETLASCGDSHKLLLQSRNALQTSMDKSYELYIRLLMLPLAIVRLQEQKLDAAKHKYLATAQDLNPDTKFVDNKLVQNLATNQTLISYAEDKKISWANDLTLISSLLNKVLQSDAYAAYMASDENSESEDFEFWRDMLKNIILPSDELAEYLESNSVYWNDDLDIIGTFAVKTLRRLSANPNGTDDCILPQFKDEEDAKFGEQLFTDTINNFDQYRSYIDMFINRSQWDPERMAFMDVIIMCTAISELLNFPSIPIPVTLNEYIEIANSYSTSRSGSFVNGILYSVINHLQNEGKLLKK